jgi:hypothetical protein
MFALVIRPPALISYDHAVASDICYNMPFLYLVTAYPIGHGRESFLFFVGDHEEIWPVCGSWRLVACSFLVTHLEYRIFLHFLQVEGLVDQVVIKLMIKT